MYYIKKTYHLTVVIRLVVLLVFIIAYAIVGTVDHDFKYPGDPDDRITVAKSMR